MPSAPRPDAVSRRTRDIGRLRVALAVSAAVHLVAFSLAPRPRVESRPYGYSALSVELRPAAPAAPALPPAPAQEPVADSAQKAEPVALAKPLPSPTQLRIEPAREAIATPDPVELRKPSTPEARGIATRPDVAIPGGNAVRRANQPGEVSVLLVINDGGRPAQIIWDKLPAMNDEQLRRIERQLRGRIYPGRSGESITETIDVLALLREQRIPGGTTAATVPGTSE